MKPIRIHSEFQCARWVVRLTVILAALAFSGAAIECLEPSAPPSSGRGPLAWIVRTVFALTGSAGIVLLWLLLGVALAIVARFLWRHTAKSPADRVFW